MPKNYAAIMDWCREHRPDLVNVISSTKNNDAFVLLLTIGFEAGRTFQHKNPDFPLNDASKYLP